jgi:hypothetical protein
MLLLFKTIYIGGTVMKQNISYVTNKRGAGGPKAIIALLILAAVIYAGIQLVPIYWDHWSFEDDVKTLVQFAFVNYRDKREKRLTDDIINMLDEMGADYEKKNVDVKVDEGAKKIKVKVWYTRSHKLPFYPNPKQFHIDVENTQLKGL